MGRNPKISWSGMHKSSFRLIFNMGQPKATLLKNLHLEISNPGDNQVFCVKGDYDYHHYGCDGFQDAGWGCGYRSLQTLCSWAQYKLASDGVESNSAPSLKTIQEALCEMGDKPKRFVGSKDWIGSVEVGLCVDYFYDIPCKIVH